MHVRIREEDQVIVVRVELMSAKTGETRQLGEMHVCNDGTGDLRKRNYDVRVANKRDIGDSTRIAAKPQRTGRVEGHASMSSSIWTLIRKSLQSMEY